MSLTILLIVIAGDKTLWCNEKVDIAITRPKAVRANYRDKTCRERYKPTLVDK